MSIKRMVIKVALAFAAKKGLDAFREVGGIEGLKSRLLDRHPNHTSRGESPLNSLGLAEPASTCSLSNVVGSLVAAITGETKPETVEANINNQFSTSPQMHDTEASLIIRAVVQMAQADGVIDDHERAALAELLAQDAPQNKRILWAALSDPLDPKSLGQDTPPHARKEVYATALLLGDPENQPELLFLTQLAAGLGLSQHEVDTLHDTLGKKGISLP